MALSLQNDLPIIQRSNELYSRARRIIPAGTQTLAKGPGQFVQGVAPKYLQRAKDAHVWDVDGNEFIDLSMAVGPVVLGYAYDAVDRAITAQLADGITFSMMHPLELEVAELIRDVIPGAEMVRYSKTGADVTTAAVRLARAFTGRPNVVCCGYHGWHDWYIGVTDRNAGIPEVTRDMTSTFGYNDIDSLIRAIDSDTACVILEPVTFEAPANDFLQLVREVCDRVGAVLIFDEMWTGFRLALGGAQERFDVRADLMCYSKAIANGMPLAVLAGKAEIMRQLESDVFFFTTFGGEALSLAAAKATITELRRHAVPDVIARTGERLQSAFNAIASELGMDYAVCLGPGCRSMIRLTPREGNDLAVKSLLQQELFRRGILWSGFHTMAYTHTDADLEHIIAAYREALPIVHHAVQNNSVDRELLGTPVEPVFRRTTNFNIKPRHEQQASDDHAHRS